MDARASFAVNPGRGLGFLSLGASLYDIYKRLKGRPDLYPSIEISFSSTDPIHALIILELSANGVRLRFDGVDQRLRLVEVLDFSKSSLTYQGADLIKAQDTESQARGLPVTGPTFRQIYNKLFGPTHAGEYFPPSTSALIEPDTHGSYILSYPGLAFTFQTHHKVWDPTVDFVSLLSSSATQPAHALAIFVGGSWADARSDLLERPCPHPRSLGLAGRLREANPPEIDVCNIGVDGVIEFIRRLAPSFHLILGETSVVDLVSQLGPPDAIYRKFDRKMSIHRHQASTRSRDPVLVPSSADALEHFSDTDRSSTQTDYSSAEETSVRHGTDSSAELETSFYNYFSHGVDIQVSRSHGDGSNARQLDKQLLAPVGDRLVVTKLIFHGNVPGSYEFTRYRRSRWTLALKNNGLTRYTVDSESSFSEVSRAFEDSGMQDSMTEDEKRATRVPMVLNRDWGDSPTSSFDFADWRSVSDHDTEVTGTQNLAVDTTRLFGFPRLLFEVLRSDAISSLTIY